MLFTFISRFAWARAKPVGYHILHQKYASVHAASPHAQEMIGPNRTLRRFAGCCSRSPHSRHSLHAQNLGLAELADRGTKPTCADADIADAAFAGNSGDSCWTVQHNPPKLPFNRVNFSGFQTVPSLKVHDMQRIPVRPIKTRPAKSRRINVSGLSGVVLPDQRSPPTCRTSMICVFI